MRDINTDKTIEQHGGNLSRIAHHYPHAPQPFIDLSTGINPYAYPFSPIDPSWHKRLPEQNEVARAHEAAAGYYGALASAIVLTPGMQPLMFALAALRLKEYSASRIGIISPTYTEHPRVWQRLGHTVEPVRDLKTLAGHDVAIICNPNNPDGRICKPHDLLRLADKLSQHEGWLIVDESFADLTPDISIANAVCRHSNIAVMRSCGKFFGIAGLRVSAAIAPARWTQWLTSAVGPWPLSTAACRLLPEMLNNTAWINNVRTQLAKESAEWRALLSQYFTPVGYTDLFTLVEANSAERRHHHLMSRGILARTFDYHPDRLRFGLPDKKDLPRIEAALENYYIEPIPVIFL